MKVYLALFSCLLCVSSANLFAEEKSVLAYNISSGDYDTGLAVSNGGDEAGTATFRLFIGDDSKDAVEVSTVTLASAGVGSGLDKDGRIPPGGTLTVLAGEVASAAGVNDYVGQIEVEAGFENAHVVNFVFNNKIGSAHGYPASIVGGGQGLAVHTFWGRSQCPAVDGFSAQLLIKGIMAASTTVSSVGGIICADDVATVDSGQISGVVIQPVHDEPGSQRVIQCVVCAFQTD